MGKLKNDQHERFVQELVKGASQTDAYAAAGYKADNRDAAKVSASRLLTNANVQERLRELQEKVTERTEITLEWLQEQAKGVLCDARSDGSHAASISAIKELGILTGHRVETRVNENRNRSLEELDDAELTAIASAGRDGASEETESPRKPDSVH